MNRKDAGAFLLGVVLGILYIGLVLAFTPKSEKIGYSPALNNHGPHTDIAKGGESK